jgi:hypothetical protein
VQVEQPRVNAIALVSTGSQAAPGPQPVGQTLAALSSQEVFRGVLQHTDNTLAPYFQIRWTLGSVPWDGNAISFAGRAKKLPFPLQRLDLVRSSPAAMRQALQEIGAGILNPRLRNELALHPGALKERLERYRSVARATLLQEPLPAWAYVATPVTDVHGKVCNELGKSLPSGMVSFAGESRDLRVLGALAKGTSNIDPPLGQVTLLDQGSVLVLRADVRPNGEPKKGRLRFAAIGPVSIPCERMQRGALSFRM